jgi:hypothetical protein
MWRAQEAIKIVAVASPPSASALVQIPLKADKRLPDLLCGCRGLSRRLQWRCGSAVSAAGRVFRCPSHPRPGSRTAPVQVNKGLLPVGEFLSRFGRGLAGGGLSYRCCAAPLHIAKNSGRTPNRLLQTFATNAPTVGRPGADPRMARWMCLRTRTDDGRWPGRR